jgi:hypothetical protein
MDETVDELRSNLTPSNLASEACWRTAALIFRAILSLVGDPPILFALS